MCHNPDSKTSCRLSEDVGELDFTYDDTLLQADEEEEAALSEAPHTDSQEPEVYCSGQLQLGHFLGKHKAVGGGPIRQHASTV